MSVDNLSISFASSMGIGNIKDEFMNEDINLYTDLDDLEKSVEAEFEQYMNQARSFPFHQKQRSSSSTRHQHPELKDASVHSDFDILGAELLDQVNNEDLINDDESWQRYLENNQVDDNYNVKPLRNSNNIESSLQGSDQQYDGATSPGAYFGARSLPLDSMDNVWQQAQQTASLEEDEVDNENKNEDIEQEEEESIQGEPEMAVSFISSTKESKHKTTTEVLLGARFKSLPRNIRLFPKFELPEIQLHHPYTQKNHSSTSLSFSSTRQQCASRGKRHNRSSHREESSHGVRPIDSFHQTTPSCASAEEEEPPCCIIEPTSPLHFLCEINAKTIYAKVVHLKLTNPSPNVVRSFTLFSRNNLLEFEATEGMILEHEVVDIKIKIQTSALSSYRRRRLQSEEEYKSLQDKILVLIDKQYANELDVRIDFMNLEDDEEDEEVEKEEEKIRKRPKCKYCALEKGFPLHCL